MLDVQNDPDRVTHPLKRRSDGGGFEPVSGTRRSTTSATRLPASCERARPGVGRLVHGQPGRVLLLAPALGQGLPRRARVAALLHGLLAGRHQPLRGERAALRLAARRADPGPAAHVLPARRRRQPARLARQRADRAADQGPAPRDRRPRRPRRGRRPAPHRDGARQFEHVPVTPDTDAWLLLSLLQRDLRRGARRRGRDRAVHRGRAGAAAGGRGAPARGDRAAHRASRRDGARARPRPRRAPTAPRSTGAPAPASGASARSSPSCSTR